MSDSTLNDAAQTVMTAELTAITSLRDAATVFEAAVRAAVANLDYPANFQSGALRVSGSMLSNVTWQKSDLASQIAALSPAPTVTTPQS